MKQLVSPLLAVSAAGPPLGRSPRQANRSLDLISMRSSFPLAWMILCHSCFSTSPRGASEWRRRCTRQIHGRRVGRAVASDLCFSTGAESISPGTPHVIAPLLASKFDCSIGRRNTFSRFLSTTTSATRRVWLAKLPERSTVWRSLIDWGHRDRVGPLLEVLLPGHSGEVNLALGGTEMVALSEGKLFGTPIGVPSHEQSDLASLTLREITPEPVEVSGVSMKDFTRHCRQSEDLGISQALRVEAPCLTTLVETDKHPIFVKVAAGKQHFAALTSHGILYTWGKGGLWGAGSPLGHGDSKHRCRPTPVGQFIHAGEFVVDVACGTASTCVVTSSGRVFSSGAADYGVNGSGMLISSQVFKELEFFQGILSPGLVEVKRRIEELQLQQLERLRKNFEEKGIERSHIVARPFEAPQDAPEDMNCGSAAESVLSPSVSVGGGLRFPKVMSGTCHCGVLTPEGALWLWGRNDRLQLSREKSVMASGGESHYPLLAEFFTRAGLPLESCSLGPCHSLALARNGAVYEWGGQNAESPHTVDLHWEYPESIFKRPVRKVVAGGFSSTTAFSAALTETGEAFLWGPGVLKMPLGLKATEGQVPELIRPPMPTRESMSQQNNVDWRVLDIFAGQQGCLLVTTNSA